VQAGNEEAAEVFYGKNEFRFSGLNGHVSAAAFTHTIGLRHLQWLTNLTIGMPFRPVFSMHDSKRTLEAFDAILDQSPFRYPSQESVSGEESFRPEAAFVLLAQTLRQFAHRLRTLTFTIPDDLWFMDSDKDEECWDAYKDLVSARPFLRLQIVFMLPKNHYGVLWDFHLFLIKKMKTYAFCYVLWTFFDVGGKWEAELARIDKDGNLITHREPTELDANVNANPMDFMEDTWRLFERR
jgi:hypothetical protein